MAMRRAKSLRTIPEAELCWLAGLLEGEGSFTTRHQRPTSSAVMIRVTLNMTDEDVVRRVYRVIGTGVFGGPTTKPDRKPVWHYALSARADVVALVTALRPLMGARRQAQIDRQLEANRQDPPAVRRVPRHGTVLRHDADRCRCEQCKEAKRALNRRRYAAAKADGRCVVCLCHAATDGLQTCTSCRAKAREKYLLRREAKLAKAKEKRRAASGRCADCHAQLSFPGASRCRSCASRHREKLRAAA